MIYSIGFVVTRHIINQKQGAWRIDEVPSSSSGKASVGNEETFHVLITQHCSVRHFGARGMYTHPLR